MTSLHSDVTKVRRRFEGWRSSMRCITNISWNILRRNVVQFLGSHRSSDVRTRVIVDISSSVR